MQALTPSQAYIDESWFLREREHLFGPLWQFIAPKALLKKNNSFVTRNVSGTPIVVQNFNGELRAFENLCPHRLAPLQTQPQGIRPLICEYHGWKIDQSGSVANIPFEETAYRYSEEERGCLRTRSIALICIGGLVFINLAERPLPITEQFSPDMMETLETLSGLFDDEILTATFNTRMNWKLVYENLRDYMHPRYVHLKSIFPVVPFKPTTDDRMLTWGHSYHQAGSRSREAHLNVLRSLSRPSLSTPLPEMQHYDWFNYVQRFGSNDAYLDWLIYPNLHIASPNGGHSFIIEHHQPISAGRTELKVYYVTGRKKQPYVYSAAILLEHIRGAEIILREDIDIMEQTQRVLHSGNRHARFGDYEYENRIVDRWYMDAMEGRHVL